MVAPFQPRFVLDPPSDANAFKIYTDAWWYAFEKKSTEEIWQHIKSDARPEWCAEIFGPLKGKQVVELGPGDGYNTAALERLGADVISIEGNVDAFLRCLILKNALGLTSKFMLGDFTKTFMNTPQIDLLYACGILYHLQDPIGFLENAHGAAENLFIWTHYYDPEHVQHVEYERVGFAANKTAQREFKGQTFTYYEKEYHLDHVQRAGYIGGLNATCAYMSHEDLFGAIELSGFKVMRVVEDPPTTNMIGAVNVFAKRV